MIELRHKVDTFFWGAESSKHIKESRIIEYAVRIVGREFATDPDYLDMIDGA
jgi:hypothetical protein